MQHGIQIEDITWRREDMNFMFSWQEQYLTHLLRSLVRYCSCHSNMKFISSRHHVISSIYIPCCMHSYHYIRYLTFFHLFPKNKHIFRVFWRKQGFRITYLYEENKSIKLQSWRKELNCQVCCFNVLLNLKGTKINVKHQ